MDLLGTLLRVVVVFALLGLVLWVLKRTDAGRGPRGSAPVQVVGSTRLSKGASLTVVRIGDEQVVLGVTDAAVSVLSSGPAPEPVPAPAAVPRAVRGPVGAASRTDGTRPDLATALGASLTRTLGPTAGRLVGTALGVRPAASAAGADVSSAAVAAALANVRGDAPAVPRPRPAAEDAAPTGPSTTAAAPASGDLPDPRTRAALHRAVTRTRGLAAPA